MPQFPHLLTVYENVTFLLGLLRSLGEMIQVTQLPQCPVSSRYWFIEWDVCGMYVHT